MKFVSSIFTAIILTTLTATAAFADASTSSAVSPCRAVALKAAYDQFAADSKWSEKELYSQSYVDDEKGIYQEPADAKNVWTVDISSTDVRGWDGYAEYKVSVREVGNFCAATQMELSDSEGL